MKDLLFLSNGQGEDMIACRIIDAISPEIRRKLLLESWPMVGKGRRYHERGIAVIGPGNNLPSEGFATLSLSQFYQDLKAGWIGTHLGQIRAARRLKSCYRLFVAVGDIVPIAAAVLARTPFVLIGCAKSAYYGAGCGYTGLERRLLRRYCLMTYPRDRLTADCLNETGVVNCYLGNPMMDGLDVQEDILQISPEKIVIGILPGSRSDAGENLLSLMTLILPSARFHSRPQDLYFLFALPSDLNVGCYLTKMRRDRELKLWQADETPQFADQKTGVVMSLTGPGGMKALLVKSAFAEILRCSRIVIGMAGTANEQAVGLGIPLIAVPAKGVQGNAFVRMKERYFGEAAVRSEADPEQLSRILVDLLANPWRCARMGEAGRTRMGLPGASAAIAAQLIEILSGPESVQQ